MHRAYHIDLESAEMLKKPITHGTIARSLVIDAIDPVFDIVDRGDAECVYVQCARTPWGMDMMTSENPDDLPLPHGRIEMRGRSAAYVEMRSASEL